MRWHSGTFLKCSKCLGWGCVSARGGVGGGCLPAGSVRGGGLCPGGGVSAQGSVCLGAVHLPPVGRMTDACENITFPQLLLRMVIIPNVCTTR